MSHSHFLPELHNIGRIGWLRAAVLGANDGIISTASLLIGIAAAKASLSTLLITGFAALVAGALSMATGEYISVSSQADTEKADIEREKHELATNLAAEIDELTNIYINRGLEASLAAQVATQLMEKDPLGTHLRDELGMTHTLRARPLQAALFSAFSFALGALLPIIVVMLAPEAVLTRAIFIVAIILLAILGSIAAFVGGSSLWKGCLRVMLWGTVAMVITALVGMLLGKVV